MFWTFRRLDEVQDQLIRNLPALNLEMNNHRYVLDGYIVGLGKRIVVVFLRRTV